MQSDQRTTGLMGEAYTRYWIRRTAKQPMNADSGSLPTDGVAMRNGRRYPGLTYAQLSSSHAFEDRHSQRKPWFTISCLRSARRLGDQGLISEWQQSAAIPGCYQVVISTRDPASRRTRDARALRSADSEPSGLLPGSTGIATARHSPGPR